MCGSILGMCRNLIRNFDPVTSGLPGFIASGSAEFRQILDIQIYSDTGSEKLEL